ncbi:MAG: hypothetical protein GY953_00550 [bacterium]|nr:hypothetical protein [bacterium]
MIHGGAGLYQLGGGVVCRRTADQLRWATTNPIEIQNGRMRVSKLPGLGVDLDQDYLKANRADGEPWWG